MIKRLQDSLLLQRLYFRKSEIEQMLILSCGFSLALSAFRILYSGELMFAWMNWNLFLAFVPYAVSGFLIRRPHWIENPLRLITGTLVWLAFIPNSFYILTDLFHLEARHPLPLWYDLALLLSFAWNGLLLGVLSVRQVEKILQVRMQRHPEWLFVLPVMFLNALGVYIGRYMRYNTWDILTNPFQLAGDMLYMALHPVYHRFEWSMIICYTLLLALIYSTLKRISKSIW